jgi:hypothetical protein
MRDSAVCGQDDIMRIAVNQLLTEAEEES